VHQQYFQLTGFVSDSPVFNITFFLSFLFFLSGTGFWTSILSPVFWAGLSQITGFWPYLIPAAVPVLKGRVNNKWYELVPDKS